MQTSPRGRGGPEAQSPSSQASGPGDLVNQLVGDVGNEDRVSLEGSAQFFAEWERWSVPRELFPPHLECLVKNCPVRGFGTLVLQ